MIDILYESTLSVDSGEEEWGLSLLEDHAFAAWSDREQWMSYMMESVGLAMCLWCDARTVVGMLGKLWGCPVAP